jgi:RNA polymerase sigma-70 factor (ECF subfamily)
MTPGAGDDSLARAFEQERGRLLAVAHRMLGSHPDAEDAVQEAWLRLARQDAGSIDNLAAWLSTVVVRVCLDALRARRARPELPSDQPLHQLVVAQDDDAHPEDGALLTDSVELALLVVLDSLSPAERLAFVLHDLFAVPFAEVGRIIGKSTDATKTHASRARRKVRGSRLRVTGSRRHPRRRVVDAFLAAARGGDIEGLLRVLDPEATLDRQPVRRGSCLPARWRTEPAGGRCHRQDGFPVSGAWLTTTTTRNPPPRTRC